VAKNGLNGKGRIRVIDGRVIEGTFKDSLMNGVIKQSFPDKSNSEVEYLAGLRHGSSKKTMSNGTIIEIKY
jgi:hypothetical protein